MFYIGDGYLTNLLVAQEKINFDGILNQKRYTVKDSSLTYRQANSLGEANMLPDDSDRKQGWRKFSLKELIYVELIVQLKKLGLQNEQLRNVWNAFFLEQGDRPKNSSTDEIIPDKSLGEDALTLFFGHVDVIMTVTSSGSVAFYQPHFFPVFMPSEPFVFVSISTLVNQLFKQVGKEPFEPKWSLATTLHTLSAKEEKALDIIRENNYKTIKLTKKDGEIHVVHAEKENMDTGNLGKEEIIQLMEGNDYQNVYITKRDGKIVKVSTEDTYKV